MQVGHNSVELAMEWLISHPEDVAPAAPAPSATALPDEQELAQAMALRFDSRGVGGPGLKVHALLPSALAR